MKKVLFATTALVATAGVAAADVTLSGSAEIGIIGGDRELDGSPFDADPLAVASTDEVQFWTDIDVRFTLSGETDNGLTFGANVDLDEGGDGSAASDAETDDGGATFFIQGDFGTVTLGDTDGALDWALTDAGNIGNPGSIDDAETEHAGYEGSYGDGDNGDGQILRYDYSIGDFAFALSVEQAPSGPAGLVQAGDPDPGYAIGFRYNTSFGAADLSLGLGYQQTSFAAGDQSIIGVGAVVEASGFSAGFTYTDWSDVAGVAGADDEHIGIGLGYETGPFAIHANWGEYDSGDTGYGLTARYDLGGGAGIHLGYGSSDFSDPAIADADFWSLGVAMSF